MGKWLQAAGEPQLTGLVRLCALDNTCNRTQRRQRRGLAITSHERTNARCTGGDHLLSQPLAQWCLAQVSVPGACVGWVPKLGNTLQLRPDSSRQPYLPAGVSAASQTGLLCQTGRVSQGSCWEPCCDWAVDLAAVRAITATVAGVMVCLCAHQGRVVPCWRAGAQEGCAAKAGGVPPRSGGGALNVPVGAAQSHVRLSCCPFPQCSVVWCGVASQVAQWS